jgi:DNA phosphorothioation-dependent restriction protein DptG
VVRIYFAMGLETASNKRYKVRDLRFRRLRLWSVTPYRLVGTYRWLLSTNTRLHDQQQPFALGWRFPFLRMSAVRWL